VSDKRKAALNMVLAAATLLLTAALWRHPLALIALVVLTGAAIFALRPSRHAVAVYITAFVFGPIAEILAIGTGAWDYATPTVLGIPLWLPFVWGNAGLFLHNTSELWKLIFARTEQSGGDLVDASTGVDGRDRLGSGRASPDVVAPLAHLVRNDAPPHEQAEDNAADADCEHRLERRRDHDQPEQHVRGA
jgi:hypothetical protein